jgi:hypothetical protein
VIVNIVDVQVEVKKPGPKGWSLATVTYLKDGEQRRQNVVSFSNPAVYKAVQQHIGEEVEVSITKNAKGYDEWAAVSPTEGGATRQVATATTANVTGSQNASSSGTRVTGSNYETPAERARRQVLIVRQSSLSNAIDFIKATNQEINSNEELFALAQQFVDFVFDEGKDNENV